MRRGLVLFGLLVALSAPAQVQAARRGPIRTIFTFVKRNHPVPRLLRGECPIPFVGNRYRYSDRANGSPWPNRARRTRR